MKQKNQKNKERFNTETCQISRTPLKEKPNKRNFWETRETHADDHTAKDLAAERAQEKADQEAHDRAKQSNSYGRYMK